MQRIGGTQVKELKVEGDRPGLGQVLEQGPGYLAGETSLISAT